MGTALARSEAETDLTVKAASYGMPARAVDGMDVEAVAGAAHDACEQIRADGGPVFLELRTYRFRAHSMYDPERYRTHDEVEVWRHRDPITLLSSSLTERGVLQAGDLEQIEAAAAAEVDDAVAFAEAGSLEPVADLTRFVHSEAVR
jgi:pyruvate dehydrogenase E1 component alpha subunit